MQSFLSDFFTVFLDDFLFPFFQFLFYLNVQGETEISLRKTAKYNLIEEKKKTAKYNSGPKSFEEQQQKLFEGQGNIDSQIPI